MSESTKGVTARKQHACDGDYRREGHVIAPGHRYLRHVAFPGSDVNGSDRPWVLKECVACAEGRVPGTALIQAKACTTFCCGDVPCALPVEHDGDRHSCRCCAGSAVAR